MNEIVEALLGGNRRAIASGKAAPQPAERKPIAAVLTCTDERVIPQAIFDQPPGKLYMVRVAGNVMTREVTGSLELGVDRLGCRLVLVMGHTDCTAVKMSRAEGWYEGSAFDISAKIRAATGHLGADASLDDRVRHNVKGSIRDLRQLSPILRELESNGRLTIAGAVYDLSTGGVKILEV